MASLLRILDGAIDSQELPLTPASPFIAKSFRLASQNDRWVLTPTQARAGSSSDVTVDGRPVTEPLTLSDDTCFRTTLATWRFSEGLEARDFELEQSALDSTDPNAWRVLGDWLVERGDPLGSQIAPDAAPTETHALALVADDAVVGRDFDELAANFGFQLPPSTRLEVVKRAGVGRRLLVRSVGDQNPLVIAALAQRRNRFVTELVIDDVRTERLLRQTADGWLAALIAAPELPRWLRRISLGTSLATPPPSDWRTIAVPTRLLDRCPQLEPHVHLGWASTATLQAPGGASITLNEGARHPAEDVRLSLNGAHWEVRANQGRLRLNGIPTTAARLLDGDTLSIGEKTWRFVLR